MIRVGFKSNPGLKREKNEDSCFVLPKENVYIVADGVGGSNSGEIASRTAVTEIADYVKTYPIEKAVTDEDLASYFNHCMQCANETIFTMAKENNDLFGMATTLVLGYIRGKYVYILNVGDSRAYVYREGELFQITEDHSYVNSLVKMGVITEDEAKTHNKGHMITRALGPDEEVAPDFYQTEIKEGDTLLLCTDGLYGEVGKEIIEKTIRNNDKMPELASQLVEEANKAGGSDNITVICLRIEGGMGNEC